MKRITAAIILWLCLSAHAAVLAPLCVTATVTPPDEPDPGTSTNDPIEGLALMLPIEVLGPPDSVETFEINVPSGSIADTLYLQVHNLSYEDKLSVRLNSGAWFTANDTNVTFPALESAHWGMGGTLSTVRFTVPIGSVGTPVDGTNTFDFRFNDLDGLTIGFRVLALNLVHDGTNLIPDVSFTQDDPELWEPPSTNSVDIAAGLSAWNSLTISERGVTLNVHCTDCHAHDGRDLKYFNYSNRSIIERSVFHGVPRETATNIASYIRSLNIPYETNGRPWNPPYQPGPGLDSLPLRSWAAGAGLSAVLDDDLDTFDDIFPSGITTNYLNFTNIVNAREVRLAMQLPDWNRWLPQIHPLDAWPTNTYGWTNSTVDKYLEIRTNLFGKTPTAAATYLNSKRSSWDVAAGYLPSITKPANTDPTYPDWQYKTKSRSHFRVVKTWEFMTEFEMEDQGHELYGSTVKGSPINDRTWFHGEVFRLSPHMLSGPKIDTFYTESMVWYQLQLALNDGNRENGGIVPIDWGYQHGLAFSSWNNDADYPFYAVECLNIIKACESMCNNDILGDTSGWRMGKEQMKWCGQPREKSGLYATIDAPTRQAVAAAITTALLNHAEKYTPTEYNTAGLKTEWLSNYLFLIAEGNAKLAVDPNVTNRFDTFRNALFP